MRIAAAKINPPSLKVSEINELSTANLKTKLDETLQNAKKLAESLRVQIMELISREALLKEAIANGRYDDILLIVQNAAFKKLFTLPISEFSQCSMSECV